MGSELVGGLVLGNGENCENCLLPEVAMPRTACHAVLWQFTANEDIVPVVNGEARL